MSPWHKLIFVSVICRDNEDTSYAREIVFLRYNDGRSTWCLLLSICLKSDWSAAANKSIIVWTSSGQFIVYCVAGKRQVKTQISTPTYFSQPLKVAASHLVHNFGLESRLPKATLVPNFAGIGLREHPKMLGQLFIFASIECNDFKFGTNLDRSWLGLRSSLPK